MASRRPRRGTGASFASPAVTVGRRGGLSGRRARGGELRGYGQDRSPKEARIHATVNRRWTRTPWGLVKRIAWAGGPTEP
jgi:hypothetical protein